MLKTFRIIAYLEGISFLLLLGVAMPLKYHWGMPLAVRIMGSLHGFLFVAYAPRAKASQIPRAIEPVRVATTFASARECARGRFARRSSRQVLE